MPTQSSKLIKTDKKKSTSIKKFLFTLIGTIAAIVLIGIILKIINGG